MAERDAPPDDPGDAYAKALTDAWRQLAERAVGRTLDSLSRASDEGLAIRPLYPRRAGDPAQPWRRTAAWTVVQRIDHPDAEAANGLALLDLEGGADDLVLVGAGSPFARGFGLLGAGDLDRALAGVALDLIGLRIDAGPETADRLAAVAELVARRALGSAALRVDIGYDPIGWAAWDGRPAAGDAAWILELRQRAGLGGTAFLADGRPWHEAGAGEAQELAAVLATAVAYLRRLEALGLTLADGRAAISVLLAVDADLFLGLAKVRAMRRLWARIGDACGLEPTPLRLHAETSWRMMTRYDPWTNVMRSTAAAFAAGLGGADAVHVLPFTLPLGLPDAAARRLARNLQHVMLDEAGLGMVADPAAGAGGFEALTEDLCRDAWAAFQQIESDGGIERAMIAFKARVAATARNRARRIATLDRGIVGTSRFATLDAPPIEPLDVPPFPARARGPDALPVHRDAAPFEALRDRAEALANAGRRPRVVLATLGAPADYGPRATYAKNLFAAAGIDADIPLVARGPDAILADFAEAKTGLVCLCGSDQAYGAMSDLVAALAAAGARCILRAGRASADEAAARRAGIAAFIHDGCDALAILEVALGAAT